MTGHDWIAILDYGSQYSQLIARRVREQHVYCELLRFDTTAEELKARNPVGVILSGSPASVGGSTPPDVLQSVPLSQGRVWRSASHRLRRSIVSNSESSS